LDHSQCGVLSFRKNETQIGSQDTNKSAEKLESSHDCPAIIILYGLVISEITLSFKIFKTSVSLWEEEEEHKSSDEILYGHVDTALSEQILAANKIVEEVIEEEVTDMELVNNMTEVVAEILENSKIEKHVSHENGTLVGSGSRNSCVLASFLAGLVLVGLM
jgi:hypothetical protein